METWVVASDNRELYDELLDHVITSRADVTLTPAGDRAAALRAVADPGVRRLLVSAEGRAVGCLDLVCRAFAVRPELEVVVISRVRQMDLGPTSLATGVSVVHRAADALALPAPNPRSTSAGRLPCRPDIVDVVRIVAHVGGDTTVKVTSEQGSGELGFADGRPLFAAAGSLCGNDAFLQMALWDESHFEVVQQPAGPEPGEPNIEAPVELLVMQALALRMAIEGDCTLVAGGAEQELAAALQRWWEGAVNGDKPAMQLLVAHDPTTTCHCVRRFTDTISSELEPTKLWSSEPETGPSFVRVHMQDGGVLCLTFVPMTAQNRIFFESFCRKADTVVVCNANERGEIAGWSDEVPMHVPCVVWNDRADDDDAVCPAVQLMVERTR